MGAVMPGEQSTCPPLGPHAPLWHRPCPEPSFLPSQPQGLSPQRLLPALPMARAYGLCPFRHQLLVSARSHGPLPLYVALILSSSQT